VGRLLRVFVHPANEHDEWGGRALLAGMDLSLWPRVRKLFVDCEYRGLKETASSLGLELEKDLCLAGAEPASCQGL
jgi:hypothetical protein